MLKPIHIILFGIVLLATFTHSRLLANDNEDKFGLEKQLVKARNAHKRKLQHTRELFDSNHLMKQSSGSFTNDQRRVQQETLDWHNYYRKRHCVGALQLDDGLSRSAQKYAEKLANVIGSLVHSQTPGLGENLYWAYNSRGIGNVYGNNATTDWYNEISMYNFNGDYQPGTGHFTQVVWKASQNLGVGFAFSDRGREVYVVAQYTPQGNYMGEFRKNVLRPSC